MTTTSISQILCKNTAPLVNGGCYVSESYIYGIYKFFYELVVQRCDEKFSDLIKNEVCCIQNRPDISSDDEIEWEPECQGESISFIKEMISKRMLPHGVVNQLQRKVTKEYQEVAKSMGAEFPDRFTVLAIKGKDLLDDFEFGVFVRPTGELIICPEAAYALNGWPSPFSRDEVRGILAHEVGHVLLNHHEKMNRDAVRGEIANEKFDKISRNLEAEADLITTTVPKYGRGLRDSFVKLLETCGQEGSMPCSAHYRQQFGYPSTIQRIEYLTQSLCAQYPKKNRDICPLSLRKSLKNATCPIFS